MVLCVCGTGADGSVCVGLVLMVLCVCGTGADGSVCVWDWC